MRTLAFGWIVLFLAVGTLRLLLACTCCHEAAVCEDVTPPERADLTVFVSPDKAEGEVTTNGDACTAVNCARPIDGGCVEWRGSILTNDASVRCSIALKRDGSSEFRPVVPATGACGGPSPDNVYF
jgi:hypothetical protein